jgi:BirA family transcriptional regulator, biotin operon repressor / biotin---[acetyl-CoA-carboxylase] ligase
MAFHVLHYASIGSTNDEVRRLADEGAPHGTVVHADEQIAGRGRLARSWFSPPGNLYLSVLLRPDLPQARRAELSFLAAVAVADAARALLPAHCEIVVKWPNDVLVDGGKIAGILIEQASEATIVGIGLNVLHAPAGAAYRTATLAGSGGIASVDGARDTLLDQLARYLSLWQSQGFAPIRSAWLERGHAIGTTLRVAVQGHTLEGAFGGLDEDGALLLDTAKGRQRIVTGDVGIG